MRYIVFLLIFISCNYATKQTKQAKESEVNILSNYKLYANDTCAIKLFQELVIPTSIVNDSLFKKLGIDGLKGTNYTPGCEKRPLIVNSIGEKLFFSIYFISGKDWQQKIIIDRIISDTAFLKIRLLKEGQSQDVWFHEIRASIEGCPVRVVALDEDSHN